MKNLLFLIPLLFLSSCADRRKPEPVLVPAALADNGEYSLESIKRGNDDLVNALYNELLIQDTSLRQMDEQISDRFDKRNKTLEDWRKFNNKNESYYQSATSISKSLTDTTIRLKIQALVEASLKKYGNITTSHNKLAEDIDLRNLYIDDLYVLLKVLKTLPIIEKYQHTALPAIKPIRDYVQELERLQNKLDTLTNH